MSILNSTAGIVFASTLHTAGAIAFLAGLMVYVAWARSARRGDPNPKLLALGATMTYVAILANLLGGFMRTYQPGHPRFWELFEEPWALIMVIKHLVLFAGMFTAVYLFEIQAPRLRKALDAGSLDEHDRRNRKRETRAVWTTALSIFVASLLGALVIVTPIQALVGLDLGDGPDDPPAAPFLGRTLSFSGTVSGGLLPQLADTDQGSFEVPADGSALRLRLTHGQGAGLTLTLTDPDGASQSASSTATDSAPEAIVEVAEPVAGTWRYTVAADAAVQADYVLEVAISGSVATVLEETVTVPDGSFFEINTDMASGAVIAWNWTSSDHVAFDLHTHFDGQVQYHVERHTDADADQYEAQRDGGHSLLWANDTGAPVQVTYMVWGDFTVDSYFPSR